MATLLVFEGSYSPVQLFCKCVVAVVKWLIHCYIAVLVHEVKQAGDRCARGVCRVETSPQTLKLLL